MAADFLTVSEITDYISLKLKTDGLLQNVCVKGEVSNFAVSGGHAYFSLKDAGAVIRCCLFRISAEDRALISDGTELIVTGRIDLYKKGGSYSINVRSIMPLGVGMLTVKLEQLKEKLSKLGYFDEGVKKRIPQMPKKVGIVTSPGGAALQDIKKVAMGRFCGTELIVYPAKVQGIGAGKEVAAGVRFFNEKMPVDVIIVARGGGSFEELFEFNDETLVKAIYDSNVPVVSGVGHEVDVSLCDLAADVRAATPSNAAEIVIPKKEMLLDALKIYRHKMSESVNEKIHRMAKQNADLRARLKSPAEQVADKKRTAEKLHLSIVSAMNVKLANKKSEHKVLTERLLACDVITILNRGYVLAKRGDRYLSSVSLVNKDDELELRFCDGSAAVKVLEVKGE